MGFGTTIDHGLTSSVLALSGELDMTSAPTFQATISGLIEAGHRCIVVDLSGLDFLDSSGLKVIIGAHKALSRMGGRLTLRRPREIALNVLRITGLADIIPIEMVEDVED